MSQRTNVSLIVIAVIVILAIFIAAPNSPGIHFAGINKDFKTVLGLDLVGGVQALLEADVPENVTLEPGTLTAAASIVENRVNGLGLSEAVVQKAGDRRIVVELPGETDPEKALKTIQQTGLLELVDFSSVPKDIIPGLVGTNINTDIGSSKSNTATPAVTSTETVTSTNTISATTPVTTTIVYTPTLHTVITGADLKSVNVTTGQTGQYEVAFELNSGGKDTFAQFTAAHVGDILAIVVDKKVISTPSINQAIPSGQGVITGNFTYEEANDLAVQLRYGSLPVALKVIEIRTVGPTLGMESLRKSLTAAGVGFVIVILFMLLYYRIPGLTADFAIIMFTLVTYAVYRSIPVTLTLPGIAGFLLSTGSALDANILVFERLKEEMRAGKTLRQSVDLAWKRAWPSIRDSNIATLITSTILFWFGSTYGATIVKGFSITLFLGVLVSLFSALVVTRAFMNLVAGSFKSRDYAKWFGI